MYDFENLKTVYACDEFLKGFGSVHNLCQKGYRVPEKVLTYLRVFNPFAAAGVIYEHPFIKGKTCTGKTYITDGVYFWDLDILEYVLNHDLVLPQDFIDHIMSDYGTDFLNGCIKVRNFKDAWEIHKTTPDQPCLLLDFFKFDSKVRYMGKSNGNLTNNKVYDFLGREYDTFRIIDDSGEDFRYPMSEFVLIE